MYPLSLSHGSKLSHNLGFLTVTIIHTAFMISTCYLMMNHLWLVAKLNMVTVVCHASCKHWRTPNMRVYVSNSFTNVFKWGCWFPCTLVLDPLGTKFTMSRSFTVIMNAGQIVVTCTWSWHDLLVSLPNCLRWELAVGFRKADDAFHRIAGRTKPPMICVTWLLKE